MTSANCFSFCLCGTYKTFSVRSLKAEKASKCSHFKKLKLMNRWQTLLVHFPSIDLRTPRASRLDSPPTDGSAGLRMARVVEPSDFRLANSNYTTNKWHMPIKTFASIWEVTLLCWNICGGPGEQQAVFQTATDWPTTQWEQKKKNLTTPQLKCSKCLKHQIPRENYRHHPH